MKHFCFLIKTYSGDLDRLLVLLDSIRLHNKDQIDVVVCVPEAERSQFNSVLTAHEVQLITDESVCQNLFTEKTIGFEPGYLNQQIVKLAFWETGTYEFYLCLDSDCSFIRDFYVHDFFYNEETPYSNLYEWEPHFLDRQYRRWIATHKRNLDIIGGELDVEMSKMITCSGLAIFSSKVLRSLKADYLDPNKLHYKDILEKCPFEFSWYNLWLIKSNLIQIVPVSGFFKVFHYRKHYNEARSKRVTKEHLAEMYVGVVLNSNWKPFKAPTHYENPHIGHVLSYSIKRAASNITNSTVKRVAKLFGRSSGGQT